MRLLFLNSSLCHLRGGLASVATTTNLPIGLWNLTLPSNLSLALLTVIYLAIPSGSRLYVYIFVWWTWHSCNLWHGIPIQRTPPTLSIPTHGDIRERFHALWWYYSLTFTPVWASSALWSLHMVQDKFLETIIKVRGWEHCSRLTLEC